MDAAPDPDGVEFCSGSGKNWINKLLAKRKVRDFFGTVNSGHSANRRGLIIELIAEVVWKGRSHGSHLT